MKSVDKMKKIEEFYKISNDKLMEKLELAEANKNIMDQGKRNVDILLE